MANLSLLFYFKISSKQAFQPTLYDGAILSGCGYFPHTFIFSGSSRSGHQSGFPTLYASSCVTPHIKFNIGLSLSKKLQGQSAQHSGISSIINIALGIFTLLPVSRTAQIQLPTPTDSHPSRSSQGQIS